MTDGDALRRAVIANRDDDTPRLIYADWLDENGQSDRAAFIRAQVEAARAEPFSSEALEAESRADRLLEQHRRKWTRHLGESVIEEPGFHRGFIEHVSVELKPGSISSLGALFDFEPLRSLTIARAIDEEEQVDFLAVLELHQLRQIRQLKVHAPEGFSHEEYTALLDSTSLHGIQKLSLQGCALHHPLWIVEMMTSNAFPELTGLDVSDITNLGPCLLQGFIKATHRELKSLDASRVFFTSEQLQQLFACECLSNLEELRLGFSGWAGQHGPLFDLDIGWVLPWTQLVILDLGGQRLGDDAVRAIAFQDEASSLRWLSLADNDLGADSIRMLIKSTHLNLKYLDICGNRFTSTAIAALRERFPEALIVS
jgi:uncharacterized protein (TIGR02996 family)